jgi:hypothetical protein
MTACKEPSSSSGVQYLCTDGRILAPACFRDRLQLVVSDAFGQVAMFLLLRTSQSSRYLSCCNSSVTGELLQRVGSHYNYGPWIQKSKDALVP